MKTKIWIIFIISFSLNAFASKARLEALGESGNGSYYIADNRNIFLNPSLISTNYDFVTYEWGNTQADGDADSPNAEGGFILKNDSLIYGLQMGRDNGYNTGAASASGLNFDYKASNGLDLFFGKSGGINWGVNVYYSSQKDDAFIADVAEDKAKTEVIDLSVGISQDNFSFFAKMGLEGKSSYEEASVDGDVERKSDLAIGGSYKYEQTNFFGEIATNKYISDTTVDDEEVKNNSMTFGIAKVFKLNDQSNLFSKISYVNNSNDVDSTSIGTTTNKIPFSVGLETDATSWLTLRGSITQNIVGVSDVEGDQKTIQNSTVVNAGASLKFDELSVDGLIGNNADGATPTATTAGGAGQLRADSLISRVSMTYKF
jgi:hypothetical protein